MSSSRARPPRYWSWIERFLIVFVLMSVSLVQILLVSEVFTDPPAEFVAATGTLYQTLGALFRYLVVVILAGLASQGVFHLRGHLTARQTEALRALIWVSASLVVLALLLQSSPTAEGYPELAMVPDLITVSLALATGVRAVPESVWRRFREWWEERTGGLSR